MDTETSLQTVSLAGNTQIEMIHSDLYYMYNNQIRTYTYLSDSAYQIVSQIDGKKTIKDITDVLTNHASTEADYASVENFILNDLKKNGFIQGYKKEIPMDSVKLSRIIIGKKQTDRICQWLLPLYSKVVLIGWGIACVCILWWVFTTDRKIMEFETMSTNIFLLVVSTFVLLIAHELGHCVALQRCGQSSDGIGIGLYLFTPVLFANVSKAWKLNSKQRLLVDLGGFYFQMMVTTVYFSISFYMGNYTIMCVVFFSLFLIFFNMNPFIKSDLYWGISDYFEIENLHQQADNMTTMYLQGKRSIKPNYLLLIFGILRYLFIGIVMYYIIILFVDLVQDLLSGSYEISFLNVERDLFVVISFGYFLYELKERILSLFKHRPRTLKHE